MTKTLFVSIIGLLCAGIIVSSAHAQTDPVGGEAVKNTQSAPISAAACATPEFRQLDFWLGDWDLSWPLPTGETGHGTNIITKSPFGDCVIKETFDGAPTQSYQGVSMSVYSATQGLWRQTWVDSQGGYFSLYGGPQDDGTFILEMERLNDSGPYRRMVWEEITEKSLVWRWQGKTDLEELWADLWVINYTRKTS